MQDFYVIVGWGLQHLQTVNDVMIFTLPGRHTPFSNKLSVRYCVLK